MNEATATREMGDEIADLLVKRGFILTEAIQLAAGIQLGALIAIQHPEWAAAFAADMLDGGSEVADSIVANVPIEAVRSGA